MWNALWVFGVIFTVLSCLILFGFLFTFIYDSFRFRGFRYYPAASLKMYLKNSAPGYNPTGAMVTRWKTCAHSYGIWGFYYDTENAFVLTIKRRAVACLGFEVDEGNSIVYVRQIQGKKGLDSYLSSIKWERFLLNSLVLWAKHAGYQKVFVSPAEKNKWYSNSGLNTRELTELQKRFKLRYDVTAKRLGFRYDAECGYYVKKLGPEAVIPQASS